VQKGRRVTSPAIKFDAPPADLEFELDGAAMIGSPLQDVINHILNLESRSILDAHRSAMRGDSVSARFSRDERDSEVRIEPLLGDKLLGTAGLVQHAV
jgi:hypothetical protein